MSLTFQEYPKDCYFEGQDTDERIILLLRAHPITNFTWVISALLVIIFPLILPTLVNLAGFGLPNLPGIYMNAFLIINYLLALVIIFEGFLSWYFNVDIVTNKRIIDIELTSLLSKNVDIATLSDVQEANAKMQGILRAVFNYGHVYVQTSAARVQIDFQDVANPDKVADMILDLKEAIKKGERIN